MCVSCGPDRAQQVVDHLIDHPFELEPDTDMECATCRQHLAHHPDKMDYLAKRSMENIIEHGHQVRAVFDPTGEDASFAYSVGRSVKDRPELLITGPLPPDMATYVINRVAEIDDERGISAGEELDDVLDGYPVRLTRVADLDEAGMSGVTANFGTDDTSAIQVLWPDADGRFPGEEGFTIDQPTYEGTAFFGVFRPCGECGGSILTKLNGIVPKTCADHS